MPLLPCPAVCLRTLPSLTKTISTQQSFKLTTTRAFSQTGQLKGGAGGAHEDHFEPPSGWLWGIKPGEKVEKEGWENLWIYGFFGSLGLGVVGYAFKPDSSIQTWALEEARRRLEVEGILKEPESKS